MKQLSIRHWLIGSCVACIILPTLFFHVAEAVQQMIAPVPPAGTWWLWPALFAALAVALTLLGLGILVTRLVLTPLTALRQAAQQIAAGNIDVRVPPSHVDEVNEVAVAFTAMGAALRDAVATQAELENERRFFISAIAHDLRTPLFALRGCLQGLQRGVVGTPDKIDHYLAMCQDQATVLDQRITALFEYARLEYVDQPLQCECIHWPMLVRQTIESVRPLAAAKGIDLCMDDAAHQGMLYGDPHLLRRMLENLLDNAVRYTPPGGMVTVRWHTEGNYLYFTVADTGPGIGEEDLPHLFLPLYRSDAARTCPTGGAGLGLTIAQRIVRKHDGQLHAMNRPTGGAAFVGCLATAGTSATPPATQRAH